MNVIPQLSVAAGASSAGAPVALSARQAAAPARVGGRIHHNLPTRFLIGLRGGLLSSTFWLNVSTFRGIRSVVGGFQ